MGLINKPTTFTANTTAKASEVNDDFDTIYNAFNGNISGANLADGAITTAKIADSAVTSAKIAAGTIVAADLDADLAKGWTLGLGAPDTVTYNGNRSYDVVYNSADKTGTVSNGMRLRFTRTVTAPTQCTDLESGSSQYYNKTSPNKSTFTDDFNCGAWIKLESYTSSNMNIISRYNGTSGWSFNISSEGRVTLIGYNAGAANFSLVRSYQSIPLNRWVHVSAQLDMSAFTATPTTGAIMINGIDVPATVSRGGTNPTALVQAGNLEVGSANATDFMDGKISLAFFTTAKVTQANIRTMISQGIVGNETSLGSAYSFNNSITDLNTTTPNDLTAQGSAVATNADSPFGQQADGTTAGTTEYGIITKTAFSTNTTLTVQVPEGNAIPTSGGVSAVAYSTQAVPYGFPKQTGKWSVSSLFKVQVVTTSNATYGAYNAGGDKITVPIGEWNFGADLPMYNSTTTIIEYALTSTDPTGTAQGALNDTPTTQVYRVESAAASTSFAPARRREPISLTTATAYILYSSGATTSAGIDSDNQLHQFVAELAYL